MIFSRYLREKAFGMLRSAVSLLSCADTFANAAAINSVQVPKNFTRNTLVARQVDECQSAI